MKVRWGIPNLSLNNLKTIWKKPSKGFGDTVQKVTKTLGFITCDECEERRKRWNEKLAYKKFQRDSRID